MKKDMRHTKMSTLKSVPMMPITEAKEANEGVELYAAHRRKGYARNIRSRIE